jgi:hypothetical protein
MEANLSALGIGDAEVVYKSFCKLAPAPFQASG